MTASDELLRGPRGRRLCLASVTNADDAVRAAVFWLAHELDPNPGTIIRFGVEDGDDVEDPTATEAEVADLIRRADLVDSISKEAVREAMVESVDHARYWQDPDGADIVAALPEVRDALRPVADRLVAALPELTAAFTTTQWAIDWRPESDSAPIERDPAAVLARWTAEQQANERRSIIDRTADPRAGASGTWWSVPGELLTTRARVLDALQYVEDFLGWDVATVISVRGAGRILELASAQDWAELCREYPMDVTASRRNDWFWVTGRDGRWVIPDWESVAQRWDAVHLTTLGYLSAATRLIEVDDERATVIAGWGPDSTLWLTDTAREWEGPRQQWRRVEGGATWEKESTTTPGADEL